MYHGDAAVAGSILVTNCRRTVAAAIVYQQQFPVAIGLGHNGVQARPQVLAAIVDGHYDTQFSAQCANV